ncbi:MAG: tetratricopeptide repeat protein [Prevotella sp.]|nr:tetratricopeptide repeat protein [Prevotella sp.]
MNFLKALFGGKTESPEEKKKEDKARDFDVLKYDGVRAMRSGQYDYAVKCFRHALQLQDDLEIHDYLSQVLIHSNELLPAYDELQKLAEAQPDNLQVFIRMAHVAFMMENYGAMADACEKAMLIDKDAPVVSFLYAQAARGQGDSVNAIAMLTRAITLDESYVDAYLLRSEMLLEMGDVESADADVAWLLEHAGDHEDILLMKARLEHAKNNTDEALIYYNKVVDVNPFSTVAYKERGNLRMERGDKNGAAEDAAKVLELSPQDVADVNGEFSAEGIEEKTRNAYRSNPLGLG